MTERLVIAAVLAMLGCTGPAQDEGLIVPGDIEAFAADVQPVFDRSCASLDCHGDPGRAMRLYSIDGLRARDDLRAATELTAEELVANARAVVGIDPDPMPLETHWALTKPLAVAAGGIAHEGGELWRSTADADYQAVLRWLSAARNGVGEPTTSASARSSR